MIINIGSPLKLYDKLDYLEERFCSTMRKGNKGTIEYYPLNSYKIDQSIYPFEPINYVTSSVAKEKLLEFKLQNSSLVLNISEFSVEKFDNYKTKILGLDD